MYIVGLALILLTLMMGIGSNLPHFADPVSLIIVFGFLIGALMIARVPPGAMIRGALRSDAEAAEAAEAARGWELARRAAVAGGHIGVVVGAVIILRNADASDPFAYLHGSAIMVLTALYGWIVGYGVCLPLESFARRRLQG